MSSASSADAVTRHLSGLPADRREQVERVRAVILQNLPAGYEEAVHKGMIVYQVPWERYSDTYNGQPLWYAALSTGSKKMSLHLMSIYAMDSLLRRLHAAFAEQGRKPDMGKSCVRFKSADDLPLPVIGDIIAAISVEQWVAMAAARGEP